MKLSLCITVFNRSDMVLEVFQHVFNHELIDEIIVVDDHSEEDSFNNLRVLLNDHTAKDKIKLFRNDTNLNMSLNKAEAVSKAKNEWVILFDSDNILYPEYLDAVEKELRNGKDIIWCPDFAEPEHDFRSMAGFYYDRQNAKLNLENRDFRVLLNTCNYVVNRDEYLRVYKYDESIKESDTIYFATLWLEAGNAFYVVPGMKYHHRKWSGSGWLNGDHKYNMNKAAELQEKIKNL